MTVKKLKYADHFRGWELNPTTFSEFNLLVGKSGVGKTRILSAFHALRTAGTKNVRHLNGCEWTLELSVKDKTYVWTAKTSLVENDYSSVILDDDEDEEASGRNPIFLSEVIQEEGVPEPLVKRTEDQFRFNGTTLPKLKNDTSAIALLREEEVIAPLHTALKRILFSEAPELPQNYPYRFLHYDAARLAAIRKKHTSLQALREATDIPVLYRAIILAESYPEQFSQIKNDYSEVFPTVTDIKIGRLNDFDPGFGEDSPFPIMTIAVKEDGVNGWIVGSRLSSGMYRTLIHLIELALAPAGTVIIIDELENSLGVNCLDEIVASLLRRSHELQFIVTSHHPYVINNVPLDRWRIVTRKGSVITVKDENTILALQGKSAHDNFIRLINLAEYEEGIQ